MATVATIALVVGATAGVASAVQQRRQSKKIAREQRRQNEIQNRMERARRARDVRRQVAQQRVQAAEFQQAGFQFGVPGSTAQQQAVGALATDVATNRGFGQQQLGAQEAIAASQVRQARIAGQFDPFAAIQQISGVFASPQTNRAVAERFGFGG